MNHKLGTLCLTLGILCNSVEADTTYIVTDDNKALGLPFSDAVIMDRLMIMSGQLGVEPETFTLVEGGIAAETRKIFENMEDLLVGQGADLSDIVKCTVMIDEISEWPTFNDIYLGYFPEQKPVRSALGSDGLALDAAVELECWAYLGD